ncbi:hypothetical protein SEVCU012_1531 [Staphylococcus pettenkoferi VCU012]|nr:hypothetical protein [Staphylococcus pettenkoferi]EHM70415.1 hypothetical protein SEVCU012_1531 [Staphylococcus pettenkoferi VCU012]
MTIFDMPNYMTYTIIGMVVLTLLCNFALNKWFTPAVITFVVLGVVAFFIPNFVNISYEPLLGYAAFLAVVSLLISFLSWFTTRNWRKNVARRNVRKRYVNVAVFRKKMLKHTNKRDQQLDVMNLRLETTH